MGRGTVGSRGEDWQLEDRGKSCRGSDPPWAKGPANLSKTLTGQLAKQNCVGVSEHQLNPTTIVRDEQHTNKLVRN